jgi:hypothetical protein
MNSFGKVLVGFLNGSQLINEVDSNLREISLFLVSGRIYIWDMRVNPENQGSGTPVFIEVPKPVKSMTSSEKDEFIEEILNALEGKENENLPRL